MNNEKIKKEKINEKNIAQDITIIKPLRETITIAKEREVMAIVKDNVKEYATMISDKKFVTRTKEYVTAEAAITTMEIKTMSSAITTGASNQNEGRSWINPLIAGFIGLIIGIGLGWCLASRCWNKYENRYKIFGVILLLILFCFSL